MTSVRWPAILRAGRIASAALILVAAACAARAEEREPMKLPDTQLEPITWAEIDGWAEDDHDAAFAAFLNSCRAILRGTKAQREARPVYGALYEACRKAVAAKPHKPGEAWAFFEQNFRPVRIAPLGESDGFLTGYYEPIVEGSRKQVDGFDYPLYRKPPNLLPGGRMAITSISSRSRGKKKARRRKLVPFHDRAAIDNGVLSGRHLEICWLKDPIDAFFAHIQGSVRVRLDDGEMLRLNYQAANGHPYVAVGRFLIDRNIIPKEEMSMDRIRQWMEAHPEEGRELRKKNKSYVFFRETDLASNEEPIGAQGVSLTPGRSIAVDRKLHVYGTPFFISAMLPIDSDKPTTSFRRLMIAQDTGGAIIGPARADIYFGAGDEAGSISGRLRHPGRFVMLLPNEIDPVAAGARMPLPRPKPPKNVVVAHTPLPRPKVAMAEMPARSGAKADHTAKKKSKARKHIATSARSHRKSKRKRRR
jgi:membrane-bound lytic murein transglycosylase A